MDNLEVNERYLIEVGLSFTVSEYKILEISQSGKYIKLINLDEEIFWINRTAIKILEKLPHLSNS